MFREEALITLSPTCQLDFNHGNIIKDGIRISLSRQQERLLYRLAMSLGHPVENAELIRYVWEIPVNDEYNILYQCVHRIRKRIEEDPQHPRYLLPVKGHGYILRAVNGTGVPTKTR